MRPISVRGALPHSLLVLKLFFKAKWMDPRKITRSPVRLELSRLKSPTFGYFVVELKYKSSVEAQWIPWPAFSAYMEVIWGGSARIWDLKLSSSATQQHQKSWWEGSFVVHLSPCPLNCEMVTPPGRRVHLLFSSSCERVLGGEGGSSLDFSGPFFFKLPSVRSHMISFSHDCDSWLTLSQNNWKRKALTQSCETSGP